MASRRRGFAHVGFAERRPRLRGHRGRMRGKKSEASRKPSRRAPRDGGLGVRGGSARRSAPTHLRFCRAAPPPGSSDNAAIAKDDVRGGAGIRDWDNEPRLRSTILEGHRFALVPIAEGELITSAGVVPSAARCAAIAADGGCATRTRCACSAAAANRRARARRGDAAQLCQLHEAATGAHRGRLRAPPAAAARRGARGARLVGFARGGGAAASARAITRCSSASRRARASSRARSSGGWRRRRAVALDGVVALAHTEDGGVAADGAAAAAHQPHAPRPRRCSGCCRTPTSAPHS